QQRRLSFRNERNLYNHKCNLCQKTIITIYSPDKNHTIYCRDCWWSDKWPARSDHSGGDTINYGRDFDFNRLFFEQYKDLLQSTPKAAIIGYNCENCDYTNYQNDSRNCYLTFGSGKMEDCSYCNWCYEAKNIMDCSHCVKGQLDYMNTECFETYNTRYCYDSKQITDCSFCIDCRGCQNCFGCVGLRKKEYHIFNKPYPKEQYEEMIKDLNRLENIQKVQQELNKLKIQRSHLSSRITKSEACSGDDIENSKNSLMCFGIKNCFDCKYCNEAIIAKDVYDANRSGNNELTYEICSGGYYSYSAFIYASSHINFSHYVTECHSNNNLFGCAGLRNKQYCILNKQYTKEEYEKLVPKIIEHMMKTGEWGEFFPSSISPFGYNETVAQEYFPLTKSAVGNADLHSLQRFNWSDFEQEFPKVEKIIPGSLLPTIIKEIPDDVLNWAIECEVTKKPFKIIKPELEFYRKMNLPIPRRHPDQRHKDRMALRNPRKLWKRNCMKCNAEIQTTYSPDRSEIVYCEKCYLGSIY
ncbi:hypothetical protein A2335_02890, partial [Candidatus Peregrinibacteria bacterium RIFOXYB2_FULL_32_7]